MICKFPLKVSKENGALRITILGIIKFNIAGFSSTVFGLVSDSCCSFTCDMHIAIIVQNIIDQE